jgi:hypothetical protein
VLRDLLRFMLVLIVIIVFALTVYPKIYTYEVSDDTGTINFIRINNITGTVWVHHHEDGWYKLAEQKTP